MNTFTPGPWRWEYNASHKSVHLVGGRPQYDLTIMDFSRWGMGGAVPRFRDTSEDGMNLMDRLCDKPDWIAPAPGREHHKSWFQLVTHPDACLIAAAPDLYAVVKELEESAGYWSEYDVPLGIVDRIRKALAKAEGKTP